MGTHTQKLPFKKSFFRCTQVFHRSEGNDCYGNFLLVRWPFQQSKGKQSITPHLTQNRSYQRQVFQSNWSHNKVMKAQMNRCQLAML